MSEEGAGDAARCPRAATRIAAPPMAEMAVAVVASRYNAVVVQKLLDGAVERLVEHGIVA